MNTRKLAAIEKGCRLDERIFEQLLKNFSMGEFKTEKDVARFIDSEIRKSGAKKSFRTIVASGANAVDWHHNPLGKKLRKGFCVIDFGARFDSYCSDVTRTIYLGKASKTEKRIYRLVRNTQEKCIRRIKAGAEGSELYWLAKKELKSYADYFGHGLGHGLGKKVHTAPWLKTKKSTLKEGDIVTVEPGVYIPGVLGIRIEDDVHVKRNGYRVISRLPKKLFEIRT